MPDLLRTEANERIDLTDWQFTTIDANDSAYRWLADQLLTNPNGTIRTWILQGFMPYYTGTGQQVGANRGVAVLAYKSGASIRYGAISGEGDASRIVDITAYANGTYGIYIRFDYIEGDPQNRIFWNPSGLGSEFPKNMPTRQKANWSMRIEASSPGGEWTKIGEVVRSGGAPAVTDQRQFYFEGKVSDSYACVWGTGPNDRSTDRKTYGVKDFQTFTDMVRAQLQEIIGKTYSGVQQKFYELPQKSLGALWQQFRISMYGGIGNQHKYLGLRSIDDSTYQADLHRAIQGYLVCHAINLSEPIQLPGTVTFINHLAAAGSGFGTFIVGVGKAGHIISSSNAGRTWTQRTPPAAVTAYYDICYHSATGMFVAVGENSGTPVIHTSSDNGVTWAARTCPYARAIRAVASQSSNPPYNIVAVGGNYDSTLALIVTSSDGINWTQRTPDLAHTWPFRGVAARGFPTPRYCIVSHLGYSYQTSDDGTTWTHRFPSSGYVGDVNRMRMYGGSFMGMGNGVPGYMSSDGITWTSHYLRGTDMLEFRRNWTYGNVSTWFTCCDGEYDSDGLFATSDATKGFRTVGIWNTKKHTGMCWDGVGGIILGGNNSGWIHHAKGGINLMNYG